MVRGMSAQEHTFTFCKIFFISGGNYTLITCIQYTTMVTHSECEISQSWRTQFSSHGALNLNRAVMPPPSPNILSDRKSGYLTTRHVSLINITKSQINVLVSNIISGLGYLNCPRDENMTLLFSNDLNVRLLWRSLSKTICPKFI